MTNPHAPALTLSHRLLGRFHVTGVFWYQLPFWGVAVVPAWAEGFFVVGFTIFFFLTLGRIRAAIASNLEPVLGPANRLQRWARAFRTMYLFAWGLPQRYRFFKSPTRFRFTVEGQEIWNQVMETKRGVILVNAHIGFWEISPRLGAAAEQRRMHVVREKEIDPRAQQFMRGLIERSGDRCVTHFAGDDPALSLQLAEALEKGEIVAFQADRPRAGGRTVTATIFGKPMPLPVGPAVLARLTGVPIVPVFNFRTGHYRSRLVVREPIHVPRTADREADVSEAVHKIAAAIEWAIRQEPNQWFCFRQLWS